MKIIILLFFLVSLIHNLELFALESKTYLKAVISDFETELFLDEEGSQEILHLKIMFKYGAIRQGSYTCNDLPENIKSYYEISILRLFFDDIRYNLQNDTLKVTEEGNLIFSKKIQIGQGTFTEKKFILNTIETQMSKRQMSMQKQINQLKKEVYELKSKNHQILSKIEQMEKIEAIRQTQSVEQCKFNYEFSKILRGPKTIISASGKVCEKFIDYGHQYVLVENTMGRNVFQSVSGLENQIIGSVLGLVFSIKLPMITSRVFVSLRVGTNGDLISYSISTTANNLYRLNIPRTAHSLSLITGDIIDIKLDGLMIVFSKRGSIDRPIALSVEFSDEQWKRACIYVNLYRNGDTVEIV